MRGSVAVNRFRDAHGDFGEGDEFAEEPVGALKGEHGV